MTVLVMCSIGRCVVCGRTRSSNKGWWPGQNCNWEIYIGLQEVVTMIEMLS